MGAEGAEGAAPGGEGNMMEGLMSEFTKFL